jgi:hypothetical protein
MYPFIKVKKENQRKIFNILMCSLLILIFIYHLLSGIDLSLNTSIIVNNTKLVEQDETKIKIAHIKPDGTVYLENTEQIEDGKIKKYIRTTKGSGSYYIPEDIMSAEITSRDAINLGKRFEILNVVILIIFICLAVMYCKSIKFFTWMGIFFGCEILIIDSVMKPYCSDILVSSFPIQWFLFGVLGVYIVFLYLLYYMRFGRYAL